MEKRLLYGRFSYILQNFKKIEKNRQKEPKTYME